jgi:hypothetical protein
VRKRCVGTLWLATLVSILICYASRGHIAPIAPYRSFRDCHIWPPSGEYEANGEALPNTDKDNSILDVLEDHLSKSSVQRLHALLSKSMAS